MDAAEALRELKELSTQIDSAVVLRADGAVLASTLDDPERAAALASSSLELMAAAFDLNAPREVTRVEIELEAGAFFVLRDGSRTIAATTGPEPPSGLVVYDLRTCLQGIEEPAPKRRRARKPKTEGE